MNRVHKIDGTWHVKLAPWQKNENAGEVGQLGADGECHNKAQHIDDGIDQEFLESRRGRGEQLDEETEAARSECSL